MMTTKLLDCFERSLGNLIIYSSLQTTNNLVELIELTSKFNQSNKIMLWRQNQQHKLHPSLAELQVVPAAF